MRAESRPFAELSVDQLFDLLVLRAEVFVVEQDCPYLDPDPIDRRACHLLLTDGPRLIGTARWFEDEDGTTWRIGRVVTAADRRGEGLGRRLMTETLDRIGHRPLLLHAQCHLEPFYASLGFERSGEDFLEDGIPHLPMRRHPTQ